MMILLFLIQEGLNGRKQINYTALLTTVHGKYSWVTLSLFCSLSYMFVSSYSDHSPSRSQYSTSAVMSHSQTALLALQYYLTTRVQLLVGQDLWYRLNILLHMNKVQWKKITFFYTNIAVDGFTLEDLTDRAIVTLLFWEFTVRCLLLKPSPYLHSPKLS